VRRKVLFFFLFVSLSLSLSLDAMDGGRGGSRRRRDKGCGNRVTSWVGATLGSVFGAAIREVDMSALLSEELIRPSLEEFRNQLNATARSAMRDGGREFNRQLEEALETFSETFLETFNKLFNEILDKNVKKIISYVTIGAMSSICVWHGAKVLTTHINYTLKKPKVIIRSSRVSLLQKLKWFIVGKPKKPSMTMIFPPKLSDRLNRLIEATKHINKHIREGKKGVKYRNVLLYGPPGTGKTMFARKLSRESGLEFVELTGSSFFQEGAGIGAIDELFGWAKKSKGGLCISIDEADSLLPNREILHPAGESYRIVNHFLNYLGERSDTFMVIMATNHHTGFDEAMHRRIDDAVKMPLPAKLERYAVLKHYRQTILHDKENDQAFGESVKQHLPDKKLQEIAQKTEGFSYGDMHGIVNKLRTDAFTTKDGLLNLTLIDEVIKEYKEKYEALKQKPPKRILNDEYADLLRGLIRKRYSGG